MVAQIEADPNVGTLLVSANEDGATVVLTVNGKEYRRATVAKGQVKFANVRARAYSVQISKAEFEDVPAQQVTIAKGQTQTLQFNLAHKAELLTLKVSGEPGVRFWLDNDRAGVHEISPGGVAEIQNLSPGQHTLNVVGGRYRATQRAFNVPNADKTPSYKISGLELAPGTLVVRRSPTAVVITCRKDGKDFSLSDGSNALPEGKYELIASARGFTTKRAQIEVKSGEAQTFEAYLDAEAPTGDPMERFWGKGKWTLKDGWYSRKGDILLPQSGAGDVQFDAQLTESGVFGRKRKISWVSNSVDGGNRLQYELSDGHLQVTRVAGGQKTKVASVDLGEKVAEYRIRLEIRADHVGIFVQGQKVANLAKQDLDGLGTGSFGFSGNKEVAIANFSWVAR